MGVEDVDTGKHKIICDMCRLDEMYKLYMHSNVKSHIHYCMECRTCGYRAIKKLSAKRGLWISIALI